MFKLGNVLSFLFLASCSSIQFQSSNSIPVNMNYSDVESNQVSIEVSKSFYLWGLYPQKQVVEVDKEFEKQDFEQVSDLRIIEIKSMEKAFWMMISFGMYYPETYQLLASNN